MIWLLPIAEPTNLSTPNLDVSSNPSLPFLVQKHELDLESSETMHFRNTVSSTSSSSSIMIAPSLPSESTSTDPAVSTELPGVEVPSVILINALKAKIKEQVLLCVLTLTNYYQEKLISNTYKCLICWDQYKVPLTSINCWHVHCEKCWLAALGSMKLCPQCKVITAPSDLRKIFMWKDCSYFFFFFWRIKKQPSSFTRFFLWLKICQTWNQPNSTPLVLRH